MVPRAARRDLRAVRGAGGRLDLRPVLRSARRSLSSDPRRIAMAAAKTRAAARCRSCARGGCSRRSGSISPRSTARWPRARRQMMASRGIPGVEADPRFWASGISLVAHMRSPKVPRRAHEHAHVLDACGVVVRRRRRSQPDGAGGRGHGGFPRRLPHRLRPARPGLLPALQGVGRRVFHDPPPGFRAGVGGIFYDDHNTGDWEADFAFTQGCGPRLPRRLPPLVETRMAEDVDRGRPCAPTESGAAITPSSTSSMTAARSSGLETGHNIEAVLMSMPPLAAWP